MHIIISDTFLSLDMILTITDVRWYKEQAYFYINYHSGKEISFYYNPAIEGSVQFNSHAFYIKSKIAFDLIRGEIIQTLINAAESNQTGKKI